MTDRRALTDMAGDVEMWRWEKNCANLDRAGLIGKIPDQNEPTDTMTRTASGYQDRKPRVPRPRWLHSSSPARQTPSPASASSRSCPSRHEIAMGQEARSRSSLRSVSCPTARCSATSPSLGLTMARASERPNLPWQVARHRRPDRERVRAARRTGLHHARHPVAHELRGAAGLGARPRDRPHHGQAFGRSRCRSSSSARSGSSPRSSCSPGSPSSANWPARAWESSSSSSAATTKASRTNWVSST